MESYKNNNEGKENPEPVPTEEEVMQVFKQFFEGDFVEVEKHEDEQGLVQWDVKIPDIDPENEDGFIEYGYMRKGRSEQGTGGATKTSISVTYYDRDEIPFSGYNVADFVDGYWELKNQTG